MNQKGSFKDRGMTAAITAAKAAGAKAVICASTGNTSASAVQDRPGVLHTVTEVFLDQEVSIKLVEQTSLDDAATGSRKPGETESPCSCHLRMFSQISPVICSPGTRTGTPGG